MKLFKLMKTAEASRERTSQRPKRTYEDRAPTFFLLQARSDDLRVDPNFPGYCVSLVLVGVFNYRAS